MLFLAGADHERYGKVKWTRQINLQSATVSLQVVIGLCKRKETAALKNEPPLHGRMEMCLLYDGFFSFAVVRQIFTDTFPKAPLLLLVSLFPLQLLRQYSL